MKRPLLGPIKRRDIALCDVFSEATADDKAKLYALQVKKLAELFEEFDTVLVAILEQDRYNLFARQGVLLHQISSVVANFQAYLRPSMPSKSIEELTVRAPPR